MENCTILLQGTINEECFNLWIENHRNSDVILSIWDDEDLSKFEIPNNWKVVISDYPKQRFAKDGNFDYQIITTLAGLINIQTKYVIKARADEYWSNIDLIYNMILQNEDKIISSSMFFRKFGLHDFHCGDKILAGTKKNLQLMFQTAHKLVKQQVINTKIPEVHLGLGYLIAKQQLVFDDNFIKIFNNKNQVFDKSGAKSSMKSAIKKINEHFDNILDKEDLDLNQANEIILLCKNILTYCFGYNDLTLLYQNKNEIDVEHLMKTNFEIIDVNSLKPYIATRNYGGERGRIWYRNNFDNESEDCLDKLN